MKRMMLLAACAAMVAGAKADADVSSAQTGGEERANGTTPVMLSIFTPAELPAGNRRWDVQGIRFCLPYGRSQTVTGFDVGVVTHAANTFGLQVAAVNLVDDDVRLTLSVGGLVNVVGGSYTGFQIGGLVNVVGEDLTAFQAGGLVNYAGGSVKGLQTGFVNVVPTQAKNFWQLGFWNHGGTFDHCGQIGVFNIVNEADAVFQLGLINIIGNNQFPCIPIMNCRF